MKVKHFPPRNYSYNVLCVCTFQKSRNLAATWLFFLMICVICCQTSAKFQNLISRFRFWIFLVSALAWETILITHFYFDPLVTRCPHYVCMHACTCVRTYIMYLLSTSGIKYLRNLMIRENFSRLV